MTHSFDISIPPKPVEQPTSSESIAQLREAVRPGYWPKLSTSTNKMRRAKKLQRQNRKKGRRS